MEWLAIWASKRETHSGKKGPFGAPQLLISCKTFGYSIAESLPACFHRVSHKLEISVTDSASHRFCWSWQGSFRGLCTLCVCGGAIARVVENTPSYRDKMSNRMQTRCIVNGEAQRSPLFGRFSGVFDFLRSAFSLGIPQENL